MAHFNEARINISTLRPQHIICVRFDYRYRHVLRKREIIYKRMGRVTYETFKHTAATVYSTLSNGDVIISLFVKRALNFDPIPTRIGMFDLEQLQQKEWILF
jgi:hypothetical protein